MAGYEVKQGNIFGRIGSGIGTGLAESLPKEMERGRMAEGLAQLEKRAGNQTPFQNYTQALTIPGVTPDVAQNLDAYLRQQQKRESKPISTPISQPVSQSNIAPNAQSGTGQKQGQPETKITINQPEGQKVTKEVKPGQAATLTQPQNVTRGPRPSMTYGQQEQRAYDIAQADPARFPNGLTDALPIVQQELLNEQAIWDANKNVRNVDKQLESDFDNSYSTIFNRGLQKEGNQTYQSLPGEIQNTFKRIGLNKIADGQTPEQAAADTASEALEFAKRRDLMATYGSNVGQASEETVKALKQLRDDYAKYDALPIFVSDMKNLNDLGDHLASTIGYPLSSAENKAIPEQSSIYKHHNWQQSLAKKIADNLTPEDSLFTIGLDLHDKGYDDQAIMDDVISNLETRRSILTDNQKNELGKYYGLDYTLGDIIFSHLSEPFGKKGKVSAKEKSRIYFWGKR